MNERIETADKYTVVHSGNNRVVEVLEDLGILGGTNRFYVDAKLVLSKRRYEMICISLHSKEDKKVCKSISLFPDQAAELKKLLDRLVIEDTAE